MCSLTGTSVNWVGRTGSAVGGLHSVSCLAMHAQQLAQQMNKDVVAVKYAECCVCLGF